MWRWSVRSGACLASPGTRTQRARFFRTQPGTAPGRTATTTARRNGDNRGRRRTKASLRSPPRSRHSGVRTTRIQRRQGIRIELGKHAEQQAPSSTAYGPSAPRALDQNSLERRAPGRRARSRRAGQRGAAARRSRARLPGLTRAGRSALSAAAACVDAEVVGPRADLGHGVSVLHTEEPDALGVAGRQAALGDRL